MTDLHLHDTDRDRLASLVGKSVRQLVWDLNAIYFVRDTVTLKLAAHTRMPPSPEQSEFAEAACLAVDEDDSAGPFLRVHDDSYWYRVVAENVTLLRFEVVRTGILMPAEQLWPVDETPPAGNWLSPCDCGVLITTSAGVLPAVQTHNAYGFMNWPVVGLYERAHVLELLAAHGRLYDIRALDEAATPTESPNER